MDHSPEITNCEVLAPAGSFESLAAALRSGADAVYFGVGELNMRSRSTANFRMADLPKVVRLCRRCGARAYLTLNIVVYDAELPLIRQLCDAALAAGVDAVIAADWSVIEYAAAIGLGVHVSVQANVSNLAALRFYARYAELVVLARELPLSRIAEIAAAIRRENIAGPGGRRLRLEVFAHGALCVAVSGRCYMSLAAYQASANRGGCFQNCRRRYRVTDLDSGSELELAGEYVMSPKDLCTIRFVDRLLEAGVDVLKLEGRGRSADYVATVTGCYRQAVDLVAAGRFGPEAGTALENRLETVFNRGFWHGGYYLGEPLAQWSPGGGNQAAYLKTQVGAVIRYFNRLGVAELELSAAALHCGDRLLVTGPTTGAMEFVVSEIRQDDIRRDDAPKGTVCSVPVPSKVRPHDRVYRLSRRRFGEEGGES